MKKTFIHQHSCSLKYTILFYDMGSYFKTLLFFPLNEILNSTSMLNLVFLSS